MLVLHSQVLCLVLSSGGKRITSFTTRIVNIFTHKIKLTQVNCIFNVTEKKLQVFDTLTIYTVFQFSNIQSKNKHWPGYACLKFSVLVNVLSPGDRLIYSTHLINFTSQVKEEMYLRLNSS